LLRSEVMDSTVKALRAQGISVPPSHITFSNPYGSFNDEVVPQSKRYYSSHPSTTSQLTGYGAPRPSETSNEEPLIKGHMRTFPDNHPSFGSVKNATALGCPAIVYAQQDSTMWQSTTRSTIDLKNPTIKNRKEGKKTVDALFGASDLYTPPLETYVAPPGAPPTIYGDQRIFKHMGTLSRKGTW